MHSRNVAANFCVEFESKRTRLSVLMVLILVMLELNFKVGVMSNPSCVCLFRGTRQECVPPLSRHSPHPHQPAGTEAESDRLCCQSARLLLPQKLLVTAGVLPVLHTWTRRKAAAPLQGLYTNPNTQVHIFNYRLCNKPTFCQSTRLERR